MTSVEENPKIQLEDDVTKYICVQCGQSALNHFVSPCQHIFCHLCKGTSVCPKCNAPITVTKLGVEVKMMKTFNEFELSISQPTIPLLQDQFQSAMHNPETLPITCNVGSPSSSNQNSNYQTAANEWTKREPMGNVRVPSLKDQNLDTSNTAQVQSNEVKNLNISEKIFIKETTGELMEISEDYQFPQKSQKENSNRKSFKKDDKPTNFRGIAGHEYNILLLGQTGVGKSTFINALANYFTFDSLEEATDSKPKPLIACQFTIPDENYKMQTIRFGKDANEKLDSEGHSSTQTCKAYEFSVDDFTLRIIDTPGIGDTRGVDQDKLNLDGMMHFLSNYDKLYGICILLKPNESRLTPSFAFCIKQLLCHLHAKASNNILFLFTNSRGTFYRPGDTVVPLKRIVDQICNNPPFPVIPFGKNNTFCFENEAFRFLVAHQNNIQFSEDEFANCCESWNKSVEESYRMIRYIVEGSEGKGLKPHDIQESLNINDVRQTIVSLSQPLSEIVRIIQLNIELLNQRKQAVIECDNDLLKLQQILYVPQITLEIIDIAEPRTVCAGENCRQSYKVGTQTSFHYPVKCHDPCYLKDVPRDVVGHQVLRHCRAIDKTSANCLTCGCHFAEHLHIYYESNEAQIEIVDPNVESQIQTRNDARTAANDLIIILEKEIQNYHSEAEELLKYAARLAVYLKQNTMIASNDSLTEYLQKTIENEMALRSHGSDNQSIISGLQTMLDKYEKEKLIDDMVAHKDMSIAEVEEIINKLSNMKITGATIKRAVVLHNKVNKANTINNSTRRLNALYTVGKIAITSNYFKSMNAVHQESTKSELCIGVVPKT